MALNGLESAQCDLEVRPLLLHSIGKLADCFEAGGKMLPERLLETQIIPEFIKIRLWGMTAKNRMRLRRMMKERRWAGKAIAENGHRG